MSLPVPTSMDPSPITNGTGVARVARLVAGVVEILGVSLLLPLAIIAVGTPIVLAVRLVISLADRW